MTHRSVATALGSLVVLTVLLGPWAAPSEAGPRHRRARRNHPFVTDRAPPQPAAERPADDVLPGDATRPTRPGTEVGGDAFGGDGLGLGAPDLSFSPWPYFGPAPLLELEPGRALLLTYQQGLLVLDTSDADAPQVRARLAIEGSPAQLLTAGDSAVVLSSRWEEHGVSTLVTVVDLSGTPTELGSTAVAGSVVNAALADGVLHLLSAEQGLPPLLDVTGTAVLPTAPAAVVTRLSVGSGAPVTIGSVRFDGYVVASRLSAAEAAVVTQRTAAGDGMGGGDPRGANVAGPWELVSELVVVRPDAAGGAPVVAGRRELPPNRWVRSLDRTDAALVLVSIGAQGSLLETYGADAALLGSLQLAGDAAAGLVLAGDVLAYMAVEYLGGGAPLPPDGTPNGPPGTRPGDGAFGPAGSGVPSIDPEISLHTVDVSDPASPRAAGRVALGAGWGGPLVPARDGALGSVVGTGDDVAFHANLADPDSPVVTRTNLEPGVFLRTAFDEIGVFGVSRWTASEGVTQGLQIADVSAGLWRLSPVAATGFPQQIDRAGSLLALAGTLRLSLLDVSDPSSPRVRGGVTLAVNVTDVEPLGAVAAAVLASDWETGVLELRTVGLPGGDALAPLDVLEVGRGSGRLFADPPFVYVVATTWDGDTTVQVVDATDPSDLRPRGSLDLASYPGEVFLHGGALLLLRRVHDLVLDPAADDGAPPADGVARKRRRARRRLVRKKDGFGRVRWRWLRDELGAVLDVVDLADPDAPRAASRTRLRWDPAGPARLAGEVLYVPSYRVVPERGFVEHARCVYGIGMIGVANPLRPRVGAPRAVPGMFADATARTGVVLTTAYHYEPGTWNTSVTLALVDLTAPTGGRVLARADLGSGLAQVRAGEGHAYALTSAFEVLPAAADGPPTGAFAPSHAGSTLATFELAGLTRTDERTRERGGHGLELEAGHLFVRGGTWTGALDVYTVTAPAAPSFVRTLDVTGYSAKVRVAGDLVLVPGGLAGLQVFDLSAD